MAPSWVRRARRGLGHATMLLGRARGRLRRARLRTRVLAGVLAVTLAALVGFEIAAVTALRGYLIGQTDSQLREVLSLYQRVKLPGPAFGQIGRNVRPNQRTPVSWARNPVKVPRFLGKSARSAGPPLRGIVLQVPILQQFGVTLVNGTKVKAVSPRVSIPGRTIGNASLVTRTPGNLSALVASEHAETVPGPAGQAQLRRMAAPYPGGGILVATTSLGGVDKTVGQLESILIIGSACAGLLAAGGVAWIMRRGLRPIEAMAGQAELINAGDLTDRVAARDPRTEVGRLGTAINGMLARIQDFIAEREAGQQATSRFFTDASHELRTPLASLRANAELYQQGALTERAQIDEAMRRIAAEARRMGVLVDDMLRLARLDQHPERRHDLVDLTAVTSEGVERARTACPQRIWHARIDPGLATDGDEELLRQAIDNLLANVAAHTPPGTAATIAAARQGGSVVIEVSDDGPGVPAGQFAHIFDRFYRASVPSPRPGSGLGLAIVAATAAAHHGTVQAAPNHPRGLAVALTLPAAPVSTSGPDAASDNAAEASQVSPIA